MELSATIASLGGIATRRTRATRSQMLISEKSAGKARQRVEIAVTFVSRKFFCLADSRVGGTVRFLKLQAII